MCADDGAQVRALDAAAGEAGVTLPVYVEVNMGGNSCGVEPRRHGIDCPTVTGAGTGSFEFEAASGVYTELQCGSYIFMDANYGRNRDLDGGPFATFEPSLLVWATVMSRPAEDRAIVDAGLKALASDSRRPFGTNPPPPMSALPTSTAGSPCRPPPTGSGSATRSA